MEANKTKNPFILQKGGDWCFLINSVFIERGNWRLMKPSDYNLLGKRFYFDCYQKTGREINFYMGNNYDLLSKLTKEVFDRLVSDVIEVK